MKPSSIGEAQNADIDDVEILKNRIAQLEAENKRLREQVVAMTGRIVPTPRSYSGDSTREQQHNFFKYSNTRRY